jgi:hypothetical protein
MPLPLFGRALPLLATPAVTVDDSGTAHPRGKAIGTPSEVMGRPGERDALPQRRVRDAAARRRIDALGTKAW